MLGSRAKRFTNEIISMQNNSETKFLEMKKIMDHLINVRLKILSGVLTQVRTYNIDFLRNLLGAQLAMITFVVFRL